jgi:DNA transformation protein
MDQSSNAFVEFVLDQLSGLDAVIARPMFGGTGLYSRDLFFGIVFDDVLYLKVNDTTRPHYEDMGMKAFKPYTDRPTTLQYYQVPVGVLEDARELEQWARHAIDVALSRPVRSRRRKRR